MDYWHLALMIGRWEGNGLIAKCSSQSNCAGLDLGVKPNHLCCYLTSSKEWLLTTIINAAVAAGNNNNKQVLTGLLDRGSDPVVAFCGLTLSSRL